MKTKKALAVILAVVMLVMPLAVSSFAADGIISGPVKTVYNDSEYFNPIGIVISVDGDIVTYLPQDEKFRFEPALNELLTVDTNEVVVFYDNEIVGTVSVTVEHILGELVSLDRGHGRYCLGCGTLHEYEEHTITNWIPNDDGGIFTLQTRTGECDICGGVVTETISGSDKFLGLFDQTEGSLTGAELYVIDIVNAFIVPFMQMIFGIY